MTASLLEKLAAKQDSIWTTYHMTLRLRDKMLGGTPRDPKIVDAWIRKNAGLEGDEAHQLLLRTMRDLGVEANEGMTWEEIEAATEKVIADTKTIGFKRDAERGLYIEDRQVKALIKESVNVLFAGDRWGKTKKGPKSFTAERVFVRPNPRLYLNKMEPDGIEQNIVHVSGPKGPMSSINRSEYVERCDISFDLISLRDELAEEHWLQVWAHAQENGLGAGRAQGYGRFDVVRWDRA